MSGVIHGILSSLQASVGGGGDPHWANVVLLLHCDGSDGGTTFTDSSSVSNLMTSSMQAKTSTAQFKFGTASGDFDGTADTVSCPFSSSFNMGTGDYTIEFWLRPRTVASYKVVFAISEPTQSGFALYHIFQNSSGVIGVGTVPTTGGGNPNFSSSSGALTADVWQHVAISRSAGTTKIYVGGVEVASATGITFPTDPNLAFVAIGDFANGYSVFNSYDGYIDDVRVTKGVARYTAGFTPPSAAFPDF